MESDNDTPRQAGAEIQVTPEMVEAGVSVLKEWQESDDWDYRAFVTRIYRVMSRGAAKG